MERLGVTENAGIANLLKEMVGTRHEETRTPDLYRVNFEVLHLKPFACLAFPLLRS